MAVPSACQLAELHQQLGQLEEQLQSSREESQQHEDLLAAWRDEWDRQNEQLSDRLAILDRRLRQIGGAANPAPALKIVGE